MITLNNIRLVMGFCSRFLVGFGIFSTISCFGDFNLWRAGDVDLSKATWLATRTVPLIKDRGGIPGGGTPEIPINDLFSVPPGTKVKASALMGAIDPTGTTIVNDFDGDGILNQHETTTNVWVADYPMVDSQIAPPVTMKVAVLEEGHSTANNVESELNSDDIESTKDEGSEKIHQSELNLKTVQFQDQYSSSASAGMSTSASLSASVSVDTAVASGGANYGASFSASWEASNSMSSTTTKWADRPFKNNIDSDASSVKSNASSQKARQYRSDRSANTENKLTTQPNGGYVRAALYIKNQSVNMPVKLKHILCSLMFESPKGELIPVESFELYNADGSVFEIEVYGGSEFGPYVIERTNLNSVEIERAIAGGFTPKIYIVDYEMTHVEDSNYKSALLNYSGDNLKIIEENAKGRTSLVKVIGPNKREMFRVAAFDATDANNSDICKTTNATSLTPGISLERALRKIACSGVEIEFDDYVIDYTEIAPLLGQSRVHVRGIKSIGGIQTTIPCEKDAQGNRIQYTGSDGETRTACVQKPVSTWTQEEMDKAGVWAVYSKGKYYAPSSYIQDTDPNDSTKKVNRTFEPSSTPNKAYMLLGINGIIWPGDNYDLVYVSVKDLIQKQNQFGTNPLETGKTFKMNSLWDLKSIGKHPYYADSRSWFLGDAGLGEKVQLEVKLDSTTYLNPNFGTPQTSDVMQYFTNFTYNLLKQDKKFTAEQALDIEISLGFGGTRSDWYHVQRDLIASNGNDPYKLKSCGRSVDFEAQSFKLCFQLPTKHPFVDGDGAIVKLYIRPSLNNAYRKTVWPLRYSEVRKVQGNLYAPIAVDDQYLLVANDTLHASVAGSFAQNDILRIPGDSQSYTISANPVSQSCEPNTTQAPYCTKITVTPAIKKVSERTTTVYVLAGLTSPEMRLTVENGFYTSWNAQYLNLPAAGLWETPQFLQLMTGNGSITCSTDPSHSACLGFSPDFNALNWMGGYNNGVAHWNSWSDGSDLVNFSGTVLPTLTSNNGKVFRIEGSNKDFDFSLNNTINIPTEVINVPNGKGQILTIWKSAQELKGRAYDPRLGTSSQVITIATNASGKFVAKSNSNGQIMAVYETGVITSSGNLVYCPIEVGSTEDTVNPSNNLTYANVGISGTITTGRIYPTANATSSIEIAGGGSDGRYFVFWNQAATSSAITAQTVHFRLLNPDGSGGFTVITQTNGNPYISIAASSGTLYNRSQIVASNGYSGMVSILTSTGNTYNINTGYIDFPGGGIRTPLLIDSCSASCTAGGLPASLIANDFISSTNNTGVTGWLDGNGIAWVRGRTLIEGGGTAGSALGTKYQIDSDNTSTNKISEYRFTTAGDYTLASYTKGNRIYMRPITLLDATAIGTGPILMDTASGGHGKKSGGIVYSITNMAPKFFSFWEHTDSSSGKKSIRGRFGSLADLTKPEGISEVYASTSNDYDQSIPTAAAGVSIAPGGMSTVGGGVFVSWLSADPAKPVVRSISIDLENQNKLIYKENNFFIAPLIEREYILKASISTR
ncbi:LIC12048 family lipoprotein [Leptospira koniambonensis]|uniref:LIC12048 family lipoprotein n=1 Tax=Leptospira koniambonensis TaxID=2484950 RepID=UPI003EBD84E4